MLSRCCLVLPVLAIVASIGCGAADMAPVTGQVVCNGKPVSAANVTFSPVPASASDSDPGKPGTGFTDDEGKFVLSSYKELDGAHIGEHSVTIVLDDTNPAPCKKLTQTKLEVKPGSNDFSIELNR